MEIKRIEDYYEKMQEKYPEIPRETLEKVLKYGLRSFYLHNSYGADTINMVQGFVMYCGRLFGDNLEFYKYWLIKQRLKLRILWKKRKKQYDGYYYFGLTEEDFQKYKSQMKKSGRRRRKFTFDRIKLCKIFEEVEIDRRWKHIFRIPYPEDVGFTIHRENFVTRDFEYIYRRKADNTLEPVSYEERNK